MKNNKKNIMRTAIINLGMMAMAQAYCNETGYLQVFSPKENPNISCTIFLTDGSKLKTVDSSKDFETAKPILVALPPGKYIVETVSESGRIRLSVVIRPDRTTTIRLEAPNYANRRPLADELPGVTFFSH